MFTLSQSAVQVADVSEPEADKEHEKLRRHRFWKVPDKPQPSSAIISLVTIE
jgi:hypothetical protein